MQWNDGEQNLATGYLTSRVTAQFVTIRTGESSASLQLDRRTKPTTARNMLGGEIQLLLLRDAAGNYFTTTKGAVGEKCSLKPADYTDVKNELQKALFAARPATPDGLDPNQFENWMAQGWSPWGMLDNGLAETSTGTSLMENRIRQIQGFTEKSFPTATYIAIVSSSAEVPLGVEARENGSLHLVEGEF